MEYYSCEWLQKFYIMFTGHIDDGNFMSFCCEPVKERPGISIKERSVTESLDAFLEYRNLIIEASKKFAAENPESDAIPPINGCKDCINFKKAEWETAETVSRVNFSMYPSPCQSKCIYCFVNESKFEMTDELREKYEKVFSIVDETVERKLISKDTRFQISCGEITIHPLKDRIYKFVKDKTAEFYTNCFKYDENIADRLRNTPESKINLSIDSGLSDTWYKVKGVNNFEKVVNNLVQYHNAAQKSDQITLKYILLPGINNTEEDFLNLISIMNTLEITRLEISRDVHLKNDLSNDKTDLIYSAAYFTVLCLANGLESVYYNTFSQQEETMILETVNLIIEELENSN